MANRFFVTGTDTDSGKTLVSCGLLALARQSGMTTAGIKPIAAGADKTTDGLRNDDALLLQAQTTLPVSYEQLNPVLLQEAIAPHIAAQREGRRISADRITGFCRGVLMQRPDFAVLEGAGGWRVPLNERETLADVAMQLQFPVILVVGMKLGCLNHALLTAEAVQRDGLKISGWVANSPHPEMACYAENLATLQSRLPGPLLGEVPYQPGMTADEVAGHLDLNQLL